MIFLFIFYMQLASSKRPYLDSPKRLSFYRNFTVSLSFSSHTCEWKGLIHFTRKCFMPCARRRQINLHLHVVLSELQLPAWGSYGQKTIQTVKARMYRKWHFFRLNLWKGGKRGFRGLKCCLWIAVPLIASLLSYAGKLPIDSFSLRL